MDRGPAVVDREYARLAGGGDPDRLGHAGFPTVEHERSPVDVDEPAVLEAFADLLGRDEVARHAGHLHRLVGGAVLLGELAGHGHGGLVPAALHLQPALPGRGHGHGGGNLSARDQGTQLRGDSRGHRDGPLGHRLGA